MTNDKSRSAKLETGDAGERRAVEFTSLKALYESVRGAGVTSG